MTTYVDLQWVSNKVLPFSVWVSGLYISSFHSIYLYLLDYVKNLKREHFLEK